MRTEAEITARINELKNNILMVEEKIQEELRKDLPKRRFDFLKFLSKEKDIWSTALLQIEWLLTDN